MWRFRLVSIRYAMVYASMLGTIDGKVLPSHMFNFGKPKTAGDWIVHVVGALISLFLIWWMLHFLLGI